MMVQLEVIKDETLLAEGYTHEYSVWDEEACVRAGITKGLTVSKLARLFRGERLDH